MDEFERDRYLRRIGLTSPPPADFEGLAAVQLAHLKTVPFENLDIGLGVPIGLGRSAVFEKIVTQRRGGFCYELNSLFADLLKSLGFKVALLSARVSSVARCFGPEFDHLILVVSLDERYLVDVGFGDSFIRPVRLESGQEHAEDGSAFMVLEMDNEWSLSRKRTGESWKVELLFSLTPRDIEDFQERCDWTQSSPDSHFVQNVICSRLTARGRATFNGDRLITRFGDLRSEVPVATEADRRRLLLEWFDIDLDAGRHVRARD